MPDLEVAETLDAAASIETPEAETPEVETSTVETPEVQEEQIVDPEQKELTPESDDKPEAGIPAKYKELFAKDKDLRFAYMGYKALRTEFPGGVKEAREYKNIVNEAGGQEGIAELRADREAISAMDAQLESGDPKFIESIASEFGDGFVKLMPHALEAFFKKDPDAYSHVIGRVVFNTLEDSPLGEIYAAIKTEKPEIAAKLASWYNGIKDLASKQPEKRVDPERQKFEEEKTQFQQQKAEEFKTSVVNEIRTSNAKALDAELGKIFKANSRDYADFKKKNPEGCATMLQKAYEYVIADVNKDTVFVQSHNAMLKNQQREKLVSAMVAKSNKAIPDAVKKAFRLFNFGTAKPTTPIVSAGTVSTARLAKMPDSKDIDWNRVPESQMLDLIGKNKAYVKGRKELVTWA